MTRTVDEWIASHDDQVIPKRVQVRVFEKLHGVCAKCTRTLLPGKWACDHIVALVNGGSHRESNLQPLCVSPCHSEKSRADVAEKSITARKRAKHIGVFAPRQKINSAGFRKASPQNSASRPIRRKSEILSVEG